MKRLGKNRVMASRYSLAKIENVLNGMAFEPDSARRAMDYLTRMGFDNTELNGEDGYRKTSGLNKYDTWAVYEDADGHYVKLFYTMVRDTARGGNAFKAGKLRGVACDGYENDIKSSTRTRKRSINASGMRIRASVNSTKDPFKLIERSRYGFINDWDEIAEENEATPDTSWHNIFDNALDEFKRYTEDESSGFLLDKFRSGEINEGDMLEEFEQFVMFRDLDDFDF